MTQTWKIYDLQPDELESELLGRKIVAAEGDTITLDDGTTLTLVGSSGCCSWYDPSDVYNVNLSDNVITSVAVTNRQKGEYDDEDYTIHVLSGADKILDFDVDGNEGTGYYCHGITLEVRKP